MTYCSLAYKGQLIWFVRVLLAIWSNNGLQLATNQHFLWSHAIHIEFDCCIKSSVESMYQAAMLSMYARVQTDLLIQRQLVDARFEGRILLESEGDGPRRTMKVIRLSDEDREQQARVARERQEV
jgi:hypothetical protein